MAKKIRFPLEMDNGVEVRSIEELGEHFSLVKVLEYFENGKLLTWLKDRYLDDKADAISELEQDDPELPKKICQIFDVVYDETLDIDMEKVAERKRKTELLEKYTSDERFFDVVDCIAFEQDDLYDLLDEDAETIYLCGERFSIPLSKKNVRYIGVNYPIVVIHAKGLIDFEKDGISFEDVRFDEKYQKIVDKSSQESADEDKTENWKLEVLKEHGMREWQINDVAFNQEELNKMLSRYENDIYLYGERFSIPLDREYMNRAKAKNRGLSGRLCPVRFTGISNPTVIIELGLCDFLENEEVSFEDVGFADDNYGKANHIKAAMHDRFWYCEEERNGLSIHEVFNSTAFSQADLSKLLHRGVNPIYLAGREPFYISVDKTNMKYIGMNPTSENEPNVIIDTKEYVDLEGKGIILEKVKIDEAFQKLENIEIDKVLEYLEFAEVWEKRHPQESIAELGEEEHYRRIHEAYDDYENFMKNYSQSYPEDTLELEERYRMFFEYARV